MKLYIPILAICLIFSSSCKKSAPGSSSPDYLVKDEPCSAVQIDSVPLAVGNVWKYLVQSGNVTDTETIQVVADTNINGVNAAVVEKNYNGVLSRAYYINKDKAYYIVGYKDAVSDSLVILSPFNKLAQFPVNVNTDWTTKRTGKYDFNDSYEFQWWGFYAITTPLGKMNCGKLTYVGSNPIITYQYYTAKGMVKEVEVMVDSSQPDAAPVYHVSSTTTLIYVNF